MTAKRKQHNADKECQNAARIVVNKLYKDHNEQILENIQKKRFQEIELSKDRILSLAKGYIKDEMQNEDGTPLSQGQIETILKYIKQELYGYGIIDDLIKDDDISDIKLYSADNIRVKKPQGRMDSGVRFQNNQEYVTFVTRLLEKNRVNLGTANAIQTFTDSSQPGYILRITVISELLVDTGLPCVAIRKVAKNKRGLRQLEEAGMFDDITPIIQKRKEEENIEDEDFGISNVHKRMSQLLQKLVVSKGILFTGKGASGKTTLMNAMLAKIPHDESVMICQENSELFDNDHPDILLTHVMVNGGDSKVSYTLGDLTKAALLVDLDRVIVGEVKDGNEAAGLSKASMTGHKCWTSVHGESCEMAVDKMADYIAQATGYTTSESLKQLAGFEYVVHLRKFKVDEIVHIDGWDKENDQLNLTTVYPFVKVGEKQKRSAMRDASFRIPSWLSGNGAFPAHSRAERVEDGAESIVGRTTDIKASDFSYEPDQIDDARDDIKPVQMNVRPAYSTFVEKAEKPAQKPKVDSIYRDVQEFQTKENKRLAADRLAADERPKIQSEPRHKAEVATEEKKELKAEKEATESIAKDVQKVMQGSNKPKLSPDRKEPKPGLKPEPKAEPKPELKASPEEIEPDPEIVPEPEFTSQFVSETELIDVHSGDKTAVFDDENDWDEKQDETEDENAGEDSIEEDNIEDGSEEDDIEEDDIEDMPNDDEDAEEDEGISQSIAALNSFDGFMKQAFGV